MTLLALCLGQAGCSCWVSDLELDSGDGCLIGMQCPDGTCVANLLGGWEDPCCGFGGECQPCLWSGFECPDGTCVASSEACCAYGGGCDPGEDGADADGPERSPGSTGGDTGDTGSDTGGSASSEDGSSGASTTDASGDTEMGSSTLDTEDASTSSDGEAGGGSSSSTG